MTPDQRLRVLRIYASGATATAAAHESCVPPAEVDSLLAEVGHSRDRVVAEVRRLRAAGVTVGPRPVLPSSMPRMPVPPTVATEVRLWARANGISCPTFGRIPKAVIRAWQTYRGEAA